MTKVAWAAALSCAAISACAKDAVTPGTEGDIGDPWDAPLQPEDEAPPDDTDPPLGDDTGEPPTDDTGTSEPDDTGSTEADPVEEARVKFEDCFAEITPAEGAEPGPEYHLSAPDIADHCTGTNHQDITDIERVVFLGDSVTVGTPPADTGDWFRNLLADRLATEFDLTSPGWFWENVNLVDGTSYVIDDGDFATCAKYGARTDDLMSDNSQVMDCLPADQRNKRTLVVMTMGGNDLNSITGDFIDGDPVEDIWEKAYETTAHLREAVEWIKEPGPFPNGVFVVFANMYEFTDGTGDVTSCPVAGLAGYGEAVTDPALEEMVLFMQEEYMRIAVDTDSDMMFMLETFCGHGFNAADPAGRCYRGPDTDIWFDLTCIHPNPIGHEVISDQFMNIVLE